MSMNLKHAQAIREQREILGLAQVNPDMATVLRILWGAHILVPTRGPDWHGYVDKLVMFAKHLPREYQGE